MTLEFVDPAGVTVRRVSSDDPAEPLVEGEGWSANVGLLLRAAEHARRLETVELAPRYDVRSRETRVRPWNDAMALLRFARAARRHRTRPVSA